MKVLSNFECLLDNYIVTHIFPIIVFGFMSCAHVYVYLIAPDEQIMGAIQKIFYFHVSSAIVTYVMIAILCVASCLYLYLRKQIWEIIGYAACRIALLFCSIVLVTGMIWGHSVWNVWWRWEPRLVSMLILWLVLVGYVLLRVFTEHSDQRGIGLSILGVVAGVNVPIVIMSVKFISATEQLHPQVVAGGGLTDMRFVYGLILSMVALFLFSLWLLVATIFNELLQEKVRGLLLGYAVPKIVTVYTE